MSELADTVSEAVERSRGEEGGGEGGGGPERPRARWNLNAIVAISVAITATFTALCNVKKGNIIQAEARALIDLKLADYADKTRRYELEKVEIKRTAEGFHQDYERLDWRHDQFDMAEALTSIAVALFGITALTQKKRLLYLAWAFAAIGVVLGLAGFLRLGLHPDFLARALG